MFSSTKLGQSTGYYDSSSFVPGGPDGAILWAYTMANRLTCDEAHWKMARPLAQTLALGDIGPAGANRRELRFDTTAANWRLIYSLLELARATRDRNFLKLACRLGDNLLQTQSKTGLFPRSGHVYARTGDQIPLALLHLAAALGRQESLLPPAMLDNGFLHAEYDGSVLPKMADLGDKRTYDSAVFYGDY